jgi:hypothetical protein
LKRQISAIFLRFVHTPPGIDAFNESLGEPQFFYQSGVTTMSTRDVYKLKAAGDYSWNHMDTEMEKVRDAFTHSFHYFKSQA